MNTKVRVNTAFVDHVKSEFDAVNAALIDGVARERFEQRVKNTAITTRGQKARDRKAKPSRLVGFLRPLVQADEERPG